jgi:putative ABC transport system permease protein
MLGRDVREPAAPTLFIPYAQRPTRSVRVVVRGAADPMALMPAVRSTFRGIDPGIALGGVMPFTDLVETSIARPRFYTTLLVLFAGVALVLAAIGVFGVMNYAVTQRLREISIRIALGASAAGMLRTVVGQALLLAAAGAIIGIVASLALGRVIQSQLFGVTTFDPTTLVAVIVTLTASAGFASFLPARRAARVDPAGALRQG